MYPKQLKLFKAWARAMEEGSTVDKPNYGKSRTAISKMTRPRKRPGRKRRRRRLKRVKEMKRG